MNLLPFFCHLALPPLWHRCAVIMSHGSILLPDACTGYLPVWWLLLPLQPKYPTVGVSLPSVNEHRQSQVRSRSHSVLVSRSPLLLQLSGPSCGAAVRARIGPPGSVAHDSVSPRIVTNVTGTNARALGTPKCFIFLTRSISLDEFLPVIPPLERCARPDLGPVSYTMGSNFASAE